MAKMTMDEALALSKEILDDPIANMLLGAKCNWEHMSRTGVLRDWGDPRTWPDYDYETKQAKGQEDGSE